MPAKDLASLVRLVPHLVKEPGVTSAASGHAKNPRRGRCPPLGLCPYQGTTSPLDPAMPPALLVEDRRAPRRLRSTNHNPPAEGDTHFLNRIPTSRPYLPRTAERWRIKTPPTSVARCSVGPPRGGWSYIQKVNKVTVLGLPLIGKKPRLLASKPLAAYKKTKKSFTRSV